LEPNTTNQNTGLQGQEARVVMPTLIWLTIPFYANQSDYIFPNLNFAVFGEYFQNFLQLSITLVFDLRKYAPKQKDLTAKSIWT
jgi:Fe(3+) dicitrate transport protein